MATKPFLHKSATFGVPESDYRYTLTRIWDPGLPALAFIMLNPSTADANTEDPTVRRCLGFARDLGYGTLYVLNAFALRSTDPKELMKRVDPIGMNNDNYISSTLQMADKVIVAWGSDKAVTFFNRAYTISELAKSQNMSLYALKVNKDGSPSHPLYLAKNLEPQLWTPK